MSPASTRTTAPPSFSRARRTFARYPAKSASPPRPSRGAMPPWRSFVPTTVIVTGRASGAARKRATASADAATMAAESTSLLQEAACPRALAAERVVQRVVEGEDVARGGGEGSPGLLADERLLVLLLGLVAPAVERVESETRAVGAVGGSPVPEVGVHDDEVAGASRDQDLVAVRSAGIGETVLGLLAEPVRAGNDAQAPVL